VKIPSTRGTTARVVNRVAKATEMANPQGDPFILFGKTNLSPTPTATCKTLWVRGWERNKMDKLRKAGCCLLCGQKGHMLKDCGKRAILFKREQFCFRPHK
jgi:hypothetical protein